MMQLGVGNVAVAGYVALTHPDPPPDVIAKAAHYLRHFFPNVFPCDIVLTDEGGENGRTTITWGEDRGLDDKGAGLHYVQYVGILTNDDLIALAVQHGWKEPVAQVCRARR